MAFARCFPIVLLLAGCTFSAPEGSSEDVDDNGGDPADVPEPQPVARHCSADKDDPGLVLCVDFEDQPLLQRALDGSKNPADVTIANVGTTTRITNERAAELSTASRLDVPASAKLDLQSFTIEMWIRPDLDPFDGYPEGLFDNPGQYRVQYEHNRQVRCGLAAASASIDSKDGLPLGRWAHVACRYDGAELRVYLNGKISKCAALARGTVTPPGGEAIGSLLQGVSGSRTHTAEFLGGLDNVRVYGRARTDDDLCLAAGQKLADCPKQCPDDSGDGGHGFPGGH